jgi:hypothetical protein
MASLSLEDALYHASCGNACLFLGAGFSLPFKDTHSRDLPLSRSLADEMVAMCGGKPTSDLRVAATQMLRTLGQEQYAAFLRERFTVSSVGPEAIQIAGEKWLRVYTTNFDDGFEKAATQAGRKFLTATVADDVKEYLHSPRVCVHIHGFVDRVSSKTVESDLVLTLPAYASGRFLESPWHPVLKHDLRSARAVFFVGYSLGDLDIARTLDQCGLDISDKTFFVTREGGDSDLEILLGDFGSFCPIGIKGFAAALGKLDRTPSSRTFQSYEAFRDLRLARNPVRPSDSDMYRLLMSGFMIDDLILTPAQKPSDAQYTIQRDIVSRIIADIASDNSTVLGIRGELSNGKTIALHQVASALLEKGFRVLMLTDPSRNWSEEIRRVLVSTTSRLAFLVDQFSARIPCVEELIRFARKGDAVILSDRSGRFDANESKLRAMTNGKLIDYDVDNLADTERSAFTSVLQKHGLWGDLAGSSVHHKDRYIRDDLGNQVRGILLGILESPDAISRLEQSLDDVDFSRPEFSSLLLCLILAVTQAAELRQDIVDDLSTGTPLRRLLATSQGARALVQLRSPNMVHTVSSIVAETIVRRLVPVDVLVNCITTAVRRTRDLGFSDSHRLFPKRIMQFRVLQQLLPNTETKSLESIESIYDHIKAEANFSKDPQFWLQYAICQLFLRNFERSEKYFKTAYSVCSPGYDKRYIDNHFARYLLVSAVDGPSAPLPISEAEAQLSKARALLLPQFNEDVHYPFKVATHVLEFVRTYNDVLSDTVRGSTLAFAAQVIKYADRAISHGKEHKYVFQCKKALERTIEALNKPPAK